MRKYTLLLSVIVHLTAALVFVIVPVFAAATLPQVRDAINWVPVRVASPPPALGTSQARPRSAARAALVAVSPSTPVDAPPAILPEADPAGPTAPGPLEFDASPGGNGGPIGVIGGTPGSDGIAPPPIAAVVAPAAPRTSEPYRPGGGLVAPRKTRHVGPVYPPLAVAARREGDVILEAVIAEDGSVRDVRVLRSIELLNQAAIDAVRQWRFTPTLLSGQPVPIVMTVTVSFRLR